MRSFWRSDLLRLRAIDLDQTCFRGADRACDACYEAYSANLEAARPRDGLFFHTISILDLNEKPRLRWWPVASGTLGRYWQRGAMPAKQLNCPPITLG
jgi:hypothetical protein